MTPANLVIDPALPEHQRRALLSAPRALLTPASDSVPARRRRHPALAALPVLLKGSAVLGAGALARYALMGLETRAQSRPDLTRTLGALVRHLWQTAGSFVEVALMVWAGGVALTALAAALRQASDNKKLQSLDDAHGHYILADELTDDAYALLVRADQAHHQVLASRVHAEDLVDRERNNLLPTHVWEVARGLADYSRLRRQEPENPQGLALTELLRPWRNTLKSSLDGIEHRVLAIEAYAEHIANADARYQEWAQIQRLTTASGEALDLLARTAGHDFASQELDELTTHAEAVATALSQALHSAKTAALDALPEPLSVAVEVEEPIHQVPRPR
ncbi:hypothetical protein [Streptomyces sp. WM6378]|uniref:hypothetical protein n=1 Tax=Streptomyces sp. WM6378 TaxID=1415557 RepID=UPI0006ADAF30|nr:hypothetical protein [Streptomyces sp. WM6378]KOU37629.1 hypothetical protein ADK54_31455 [Streptomyces sp. WM6378]